MPASIKISEFNAHLQLIIAELNDTAQNAETTDDFKLRKLQYTIGNLRDKLSSLNDEIWDIRNAK